MITAITNYLYKNILKSIFFSFDAEDVHTGMIITGEKFGESMLAKNTTKFLVDYKNNSIEQKLNGIRFENPIGLAAGFDYEAKLTQFLPSLGFGFETVGTITNLPYEGNKKPRLGRLPKSKSLLVNKGFKSSGADAVSVYLEGKKFEIPVGISIGRSNSPTLASQKKSVTDIIEAFQIFEEEKIDNDYYELNISCPNLIHGDVTFYPPRNLRALLKEVDKLKLKKPVFIKMPIEKSDKEVLAMLKVIANLSPKGVIFGNLQKDKKHKSLDQSEVKKFKMGYFSGKPTYQRSNELISLAYKSYKDRFTIIGCGGVFNADDAWEKITRGASLVQLITGLIYEGPQLVSQINQGLAEKLKEKGFKHISEVVGTKQKS